MFWPNCPCCTCKEYSDEFTRSDSTNIGGDWTEEAGAWEIASNKLRTTSTDAVAVYAYEPSSDSFTFGVDLTFSLLSSGKLRLYCRLDADNYVCGEAKLGSLSVGGYVRLISCTAGTETVIAQVGNRSGRYWRMCVDSDAGVVAFGTSSTETGEFDAAAVAYISPPGKQLAVGTGDELWAGGPYMDFDTFTVWKPGSASDCPVCRRCCDSGQWPREEVQLELTGLSNTTSGSDGCTSCTSLHGTYTLTLQGYAGRPSDLSTSFGGECLLYSVHLDGSVCGVKYIAVGLIRDTSALFALSRNEWTALFSDAGIDTEFTTAFSGYQADFEVCVDNVYTTELFSSGLSNLCRFASSTNSSVVTIL